MAFPTPVILIAEWEIMENNADPSDTSAKVLMPAVFLANSRSTPIMAPRTVASVSCRKNSMFWKAIDSNIGGDLFYLKNFISLSCYVINFNAYLHFGFCRINGVVFELH